jgi:GT2 family glycosyltransferase
MPADCHRSEALAAEIRRRLGPPPELPAWPLVSIVVLNRNGADHLRRLLPGLTERTDYLNLELILVDNASSDESLDFIRTVAAPFPISILANHHNESFSDACNQGAELASGELLLFLNNDIEPFEPGWLRELVACRQGSGAAAVAATLICLDEEHEVSRPYGYGVQHRGLEFREEKDGMVHPALHGWEADPLDECLGEDAERPAVAAACLLIGRDAFEKVCGFTHGYIYGGEDVDLSLELRTAGLGVLCSGRSIAIHHPASTRRAAPFAEERARKLANRRLLWERWGSKMRREYELGGGGGRRPEAAMALGYCLKAADLGGGPDSADEAATRELLESLREALVSSGRRCLVLGGAEVEDPRGLEYDVAVHFKGSVRYIPKPAQLNVLWSIDDLDALSPIECSRYDLVVSGSEPQAARLRQAGLGAPVIVIEGNEPGLDLIAAMEPKAGFANARKSDARSLHSR